MRRWWFFDFWMDFRNKQDIQPIENTGNKEEYYKCSILYFKSYPRRYMQRLKWMPSIKNSVTSFKKISNKIEATRDFINLLLIFVILWYFHATRFETNFSQKFYILSQILIFLICKLQRTEIFWNSCLPTFKIIIVILTYSFNKPKKKKYIHWK
jgi:hypothetical protein